MSCEGSIELSQLLPSADICLRMQTTVQVSRSGLWYHSFTHVPHLSYPPSCRVRPQLITRSASNRRARACAAVYECGVNSEWVGSSQTRQPPLTLLTAVVSRMARDTVATGNRFEGGFWQGQRRKGEFFQYVVDVLSLTLGG